MKTKKIPLWFALTAPLAVFCLALLSGLTYKQTQEVVALIDAKGKMVLESSAKEVKQQIGRYMELPFLLHTSLADGIVRQGLLESDNLLKTEKFLGGVFNDVYRRDYPQLDMVQIGTERGEFIGFRHDNGTTVSRILKDARTDQKLYVYKPGSDDVAEVVSPYDPRKRPWYAPSKRSFENRWSDIYFASTTPHFMAVSATSPVLNRQGELLGILSTDVSLSAMSAFLKQTILHKEYTSNLLYIVDTQGRLIASTREDNTLSSPTQGGALVATRAEDAQDPLTRGSYLSMREQINISAGQAQHQFAVSIVGDGEYFGHAVKFDDGRGLTWHVVALVSEEELTGHVKANALRTLATSMIAAWAVLLALIVVVIKRFISPIETVAKTAARLAKYPASGVELPMGGLVRETASLTLAFNTMSREIQRQITSLHDLAMHDTTTGALNRVGLLSQAVWEGECAVTVMCIGIDNFKLTNTSLGPAAGDRLLQEAARRLSAALPPSAWVARLGGDEFLVVQPHLSGTYGLSDAIETVRQTFSKPFISDTDEVELKVCIGVVSTVASSDRLATHLLHQASVSLRSAKANGVGQTAMFEGQLLEKLRKNSQLLAELKVALAQSEFRVYFQPIVYLDSLDIHGVEALIRWQSPSRGMVSPGEFIPAIEESGLIVQVGNWVMRQATQEVADLMRKHALPSDFTLHVNVSVRQLMQSDYVQTVRQAIQDSGIAPQVVTVEVTESLLMEPDSPVHAVFSALQAMGVRIALDDFGTGYSSLSYLYQFPFQSIKIDRSFVVAAEQGAASEAILKAVVDITHGLQVDAVAEGIETEAQADMLRKFGARFAQGYLFGRPAELQVTWAGIETRKAARVLALAQCAPAE